MRALDIILFLLLLIGNVLALRIWWWLFTTPLARIWRWLTRPTAQSEKPLLKKRKAADSAQIRYKNERLHAF